jgi:hypothetical protein
LTTFYLVTVEIDKIGIDICHEVGSFIEIPRSDNITNKMNSSLVTSKRQKYVDDEA